MDTLVQPAVRFLAYCLCLVPLLQPLQAQVAPNRDELEGKIRLIDHLLAETQARRERTPSELAMLGQQIKFREQLLAVFAQEIYHHERQIDTLDEHMCLLDQRLVLIRENYRAAIRSLYQYSRYDQVWLSILSSGSLSEAYYRILYYRQLSKYCERQTSALAKNQAFLAQNRQAVTDALTLLHRLREEKERETVLLKDNRLVQANVQQVVRRQPISQQSNAQQKALASLLESQVGSGTKSSDPEPLPAEAVDHGTSFHRSRGELPWPLRPGSWVMTQEFGKKEDDYGNQVQQEGIQIRTQIGEEVRAIHGGTVTGIPRLPNGNASAVILAHGKYRTVYAGLGRVSVAVGTVVSQGQSLGVVKTDERSGETVLQFMIYQEPKRFLDPQQWLSR